MKQQRIQALVLLAFFLSGMSGLMLQTVWVRMLTRLLGATTYATATVLGVFMAGLAIGSWLGGRLADRSRRPLLAYAWLEIGVCVTGVLAGFAVIEGLGAFYVGFAQEWREQSQLLLTGRVLFSMACLLPPTLLMGATLPLLVSYVTRLGEEFQAGLGWLYAVNTLGAVFGVFCAGFIFLGAWGEKNTVLLAVSLNVAATVVALVIWAKQRETTSAAVEPNVIREPDFTPYSAPIRKLAYAAFFISGFSALAYEVLWARLLILLLDTSIYAFSLMLTVFLLGIAWGSTWGARKVRTGYGPLATFALLEALIGGLTAVSLFLLPYLHNAWLQVLMPAGSGQISGVGAGALICLVLLLPVAFCFGWQFPVAVRCCSARADRPGKSTGYAYVVNTLGTVAGALSAGFLLVPWLGTSFTLLLLAGVNIAMGLSLGAICLRQSDSRMWVPASLLSAAVLIVTAMQEEPYRRMIVERLQVMQQPGWKMFAAYEGVSATTVVAGDPEKPRERALMINGCGVTGLCSETKMMAHLPYALVEDPKRFLVICFGMGTTPRSASRYPGVQIDSVDIVREVFDALPFFHRDAESLKSLPNHRMHYDDGRNFLLTHPEHFDIITIDPAPPLYSAGTVNLYTTEFFTLCKTRLTPGGVLCMWVPPAEETDMLMIMKSFVTVFPRASLWGAHTFGGFWLIGHGDDRVVDTARALRILDNPHALADLKEWDEIYLDKEKLRSLHMMDAEGLRKLTEAVPAVTDDRPYTEFPLWRRWYDPGTTRRFDAQVLRERMGKP